MGGHKDEVYFNLQPHLLEWQTLIRLNYAATRARIYNSYYAFIVAMIGNHHLLQFEKIHEKIHHLQFVAKSLEGQDLTPILL